MRALSLFFFPARIFPTAAADTTRRPASTWTTAARVIWGDIWTPGRYARIGDLAEHHEFNRIVQELEVHRAGELIYRDRYTWEGPWDAAAAQWYLGGSLSDATGSLFITGKVDLPPPGRGGSLRRAVLPLAHGDTLIRWCGSVAEVTAEVVRTALGVAARWSGRNDAQSG